MKNPKVFYLAMDSEMSVDDFWSGLKAALQSGSGEKVEAFLKKAGDAGCQIESGAEGFTFNEDLQRVIDTMPLEKVEKIAQFFGEQRAKEGDVKSDAVEALCAALTSAGFDPLQVHVLSAMGVSLDSFLKHTPPGSAPGLEALSARLQADDARQILISPEQAQVNSEMGISDERFRRFSK